MENEKVVYIKVDGEEIQRIIYEKIGPALDGEKRGHAIMALIAFTVDLMKPDITPDELQNAIMSTSEYLVLLLSDSPSKSVN